MSLASQILALATRIATEIKNNKAIAANASNLTSGIVPDARLTGRLNTPSSGIYNLGVTGPSGSWIRLFTIDGQNSSNGASVSALIAGQGNIGTAARTMTVLHVGQRGDNLYTAQAWSFGAPATGGPWGFYVKQISTYVFEIWAQRAGYDSAVAVKVFDTWNTTINLDLEGGTAPSGTLNPVTALDVNNASNLTSGTIPDARLPARIGNRGNVHDFGNDWNLARQPGWYSSDTAANAPGGGWWLGRIETHDDSAGNLYVVQTLVAFVDSAVKAGTYGGTWRRLCMAGSWGPWHEVDMTVAQLDARYVNASADESILGIKTFDSDPRLDWTQVRSLDPYSIGSGSVRVWHDLLRFSTPTFQTSADGSSWTTEYGVGREPLDGRSDTTYVSNTAKPWLRWVWTGVAWSAISRLIAHFDYVGTGPDVVVTIDTSTDGATWASLGGGTFYGASNQQYRLGFNDPGGNTYFRITMHVLSTTQWVGIAGLEVQTPRLGAQGGGFENEVPYDWDVDQNVTFPSTLAASIITAIDELHCSGQVEFGDISTNNVQAAGLYDSGYRVFSPFNPPTVDDISASGAADSTTFLRGDGQWAVPAGGSTEPTGVVKQFAGAAAPAGYLLCDGFAYSRTTYAALFAVIGTTYGAGNGSTTFNVPDMRDRIPVGVGTGHSLGTSDGVAAGASRNALHDMTHSHGSSGSASTDSAGTPSGTNTAVSAGTPTGTNTAESSHVHDMSHTHFDSFALSKTSGNRNSGTAISTIDTVSLSGGVTTNSRNTGAGSSHTHPFTGDAMGTHNHPFSGNALPGHSHTISTSVSNNTVTRLPRLGLNFIIKI